MIMRRSIAPVLAVLVAAGCASGTARTSGSPSPATTAAKPATPATQDTSGRIGSQYPSTYTRHPNPPVLIRNATIMTAAGQEIQGGSILFKDGRIVAVGTNVQAPSDATVVDGTGKWVTPGVIDVHSHLGVYAAPGTFAESDGNEATRPVTAEVWAEHSFWPQDPQIPPAIASGICGSCGQNECSAHTSAVTGRVASLPSDSASVPGAAYTPRCECSSISPGVTYFPVPSTTTASAGASTFAPTATMRPSLRTIDPFGISWPAAVMIVALRIKTGGFG